LDAILGYHQWLCNRIAITDPKQYGYRQLFLRLMAVPFKSSIVEDGMRIDDALYLRRSYTRTMDWTEDERRAFYRSMGPVSFFEIMAVLADKMAYDLIGNPLADNTPASLFFEMMDNCGLCYLNDEAFEADTDGCLKEMKRITDRINDHAYNEDGSGGFFPLDTPVTDMTTIDLRQQMELYMIEKYDILE